MQSNKLTKKIQSRWQALRAFQYDIMMIRLELTSLDHPVETQVIDVCRPRRQGALTGGEGEEGG